MKSLSGEINSIVDNKLKEFKKPITKESRNIGKIIETHQKILVSVWRGTEAEYAALDPGDIDADTLYILTDT